MSKQRPIIFNGEMVQAILAGNKTQTRRIIKNFSGPFRYPSNSKLKYCEIGGKQFWFNSNDDHPSNILNGCPFGKVGDQLYVRETWNRTNPNGENGVYYYRADGKFPECIGGTVYSGDEKWKPSIHMPRHASRITLEITNILVERLNDIGEEDARAEGITDGGCINCGESEPCGCKNRLC